ncbi:protein DETOXIFICATION 3-like isoform X3 [Rhododendron vialii]|uniref:protein DETOXIFICATION 3-like isoform X3 n=1 Tax=Rhododendron vialii TaxID=182163 RepID=UPI00265EF190|nr:protein DETOXIFICATION 3-like isoform X3 [Rhododendron vialii]
MEEALLLKNGDRKLVPIAPKAFVEELKKVTAIAAPMVMVNMSQHLLRVTPMIMVGHISELSLSSVAIATSLTNVTGYSVLLGMAGALETLCGQAYGAEQYKKLGTYTNGAILSLILVCLPISLLWIFMDKLLVFFGQDPIVSLEAGKYAIWLIPSLFPYAILESMVPYLQTQSLILPMLLCSIVTLSFHIPLCWALVFKSGLGTKGAALAISLSYWVDAIALGLYLKYSPACEKSRVPFSRDVFLSIGEFFRFALPSAGMVCLEWWSFELLVLLSGLLPNPELESSVLSICLTTTSLHSLIPYSIGAAASCRGNYGIARGSGWQHIGAYANFGAYYLVGIPLAIVLGFLQKLRGEGIWGGIVTGTILQVILLTSATCLTNWQEQANKAKERIFKGRILDDKLIDQLN